MVLYMFARLLKISLPSCDVICSDPSDPQRLAAPRLQLVDPLGVGAPPP